MSLSNTCNHLTFWWNWNWKWSIIMWLCNAFKIKYSQLWNSEIIECWKNSLDLAASEGVDMKLSFQFGLAASLETFQSWSCIPLCWVELWSYHVKCNWYFFCTTMEYTSTSAFSVGLRKKPMICKVLSVCIWILFFNKEHIFQKQQML